MVKCIIIEIFVRFKFAFDSAFAKKTKIKCLRKFHGLLYCVFLREIYISIYEICVFALT
jgi:hypothetical protein